MLTRRSLLLGAVCAPAVVRAESLMKIWVPPVREVWQWRPGDYEIPWSALFPQVGVDLGRPGDDRSAVAWRHPNGMLMCSTSRQSADAESARAWRQWGRV